MSTTLDLSALRNSTSGLDFSALENPDENHHADDGEGLAALDGQTILVDTREKKPFSFAGYNVDTRSQALDTGDYSIAGYESKFAVERKAKDDFIDSITQPDRDRFLDEIRRADTFEFPMAIVVEAPWSAYESGDYYSNMGFSQIQGTVRKWEDPFHIDWYFEDDREEAERRTLELLAEWLSSVDS